VRLLLAAALVVVACGGAAGSSRAPDQTHVWLSYAACLRAHGANEPDPTFDQDGGPQWSVSPKTLPPAAIRACGAILQSAHLVGSRPPSATRLAGLIRYAQCLRQHGIADFPDPDPQTGSYPTTHDPTREPGWPAATQACRSLAPQGK
jgi:hypothetical protein